MQTPRPVQGRPPTREEVIQQQKIKAAKDTLLGWSIIAGLLLVCCCCSSTAAGIAVYLLDLPR